MDFPYSIPHPFINRYISSITWEGLIRLNSCHQEIHRLVTRVMYKYDGDTEDTCSDLGAWRCVLQGIVYQLSLEGWLGEQGRALGKDIPVNRKSTYKHGGEKANVIFRELQILRCARAWYCKAGDKIWSFLYNKFLFYLEGVRKPSILFYLYFKC